MGVPVHLFSVQLAQSSIGTSLQISYFWISLLHIWLYGLLGFYHVLDTVRWRFLRWRAWWEALDKAIRQWHLTEIDNSVFEFYRLVSALFGQQNSTSSTDIYPSFTLVWEEIHFLKFLTFGLVVVYLIGFLHLVGSQKCNQIKMVLLGMTFYVPKAPAIQQMVLYIGTD